MAGVFLGSLLTGAGELKLATGVGGKYATLSKLATVGDNIVAHHMPQVAAEFTSKAEGGALTMWQSEHILTRTYGTRGAATAAAEAGVPFRTVLARDIRDVRSIVGSKYDQGIKQVLQYYRQNLPSLIAK